MEDLQERQSQNTIWAKIAKIQFPTTQLNEETLKDLTDILGTSELNSTTF